MIDSLNTALEGRYSILKQIGQGGMATVFLADDLKHNRQVAVKVFDPDLAQVLGVGRFLREIETAANLTHPHIIPLFDSGEAAGFLFYVMPYLKGDSLRTRLTKEKQLPVEDAVQITREIAGALAYAHKEGVIHRDVKPANIMLEAGHAVLVDFGVAHAVAEAKDERITRTGTSVGTPAYMSPEQATGERELDGRSDQYALGCVLFEMLAGHPPFTGAQIEAVVRQHLMAEPPSVTQVRPSVTAEVTRVINRSLSKSPADRFRTADEMAAALALTTMPVQGVPPGIPLPGRPLRLWQILVAYVVASLVVFGVSGTLTDVVGLPSWVPIISGLLCLAFFPLVLVTALFKERVKEGPPSHQSTPTTGLRKRLTWRTVGTAVGGAFTILAVSTGGYMGMRVMGIGPAGTLVAQGRIEDQARLLVADFSSVAGDSLLAAALSEAVRIDLSSSDVVRNVDFEEVQPTLRSMELPPGTALTEPAARDAAVREGIPVVLVGNLARVGRAYLITARLVDPDEGTVFLSLREEAAGEEQTLEAVDRLVEKLRERIGESLRSVQNRTPLRVATTSSLQALKTFTRAASATRERNFQKAVDLLEEALVADSMFAGAWWGLGLNLGNLGTNRERRIEALTRAYELSDRLPESERLQVTESYHRLANIDYQAAVEALELRLERYPNRASRNNLGIAYWTVGEYEKGRDMLVEAVNQEASPLNTRNLINGALYINDLETARWALKLREENEFGLDANPNMAAHIAYIAGDRSEARRLILSRVEEAETGPSRATNLRVLGWLDALNGRLAASHQRFEEANGLWSEAGAVNTIFDNHLYLAWVDAIVLEQPGKARARIEEALLNPDLGDPPPTLEFAYTLASLGMTERAREALNRWEAVTPEGIRPESVVSHQMVLGWIALSENRNEVGFENLRRAVTAAFGSPESWGNLARAYDRHGMADSALVAHHGYLDAPNISRPFWDPLYLARAYERLGQLHEERDEVEEAIRYHSLFVDLWSQADPELQPRVEAARGAIARLEGGGPKN